MNPALPPLALAAGTLAAMLYAIMFVLTGRGIRQRQPLPLRAILPIVLPALALHGVATWLQIRQPDGFYLGFFTASSLVALVMAAFVTLVALRLPVQNLLLLILPIALLTLAGSLTGQTAFRPIAKPDAALLAHILLSVTAYSLLFLAACQALVLTWQERALRSKRAMANLRLLPPLETMEALLFTQLWAGVILLTLAIVSGFAFLEDLFAQQVVHHTVLALASWLIYTALLAGHYAFGWRGYTATYGTLIAFALLLLAYFGSKFVLEIVLAR